MLIFRFLSVITHIIGKGDLLFADPLKTIWVILISEPLDGSILPASCVFEKFRIVASKETGSGRIAFQPVTEPRCYVPFGFLHRIIMVTACFSGHDSRYIFRQIPKVFLNAGKWTNEHIVKPGTASRHEIRDCNFGNIIITVMKLGILLLILLCIYISPN